ncbi:MAG: hypothetical protein HZB29_03870 [Nitrospinae bacterium]|nr:hypothetical protein [Nitrospinota bacterium]
MFEKSVTTNININGKVYRSLDEVPEELRALLGDNIHKAMENPGQTITAKSGLEVPLDQLPKETRDKIASMLPGKAQNSSSGVSFTIKGGRKADEGSQPAFLALTCRSNRS